MKNFNEEPKTNEEKNNSEDTYAYKNVIRDKHQRRTWSVAAIALAVLSLIFLFLPWLSLVIALLSIGSAVISRINLGYFDKLSLAALIIAIFGVVFAIVGLIFADLLAGLFV